MCNLDKRQNGSFGRAWHFFWLGGSGEALKQCSMSASRDSWTTSASDICPLSKRHLAFKVFWIRGLCQFHRGLKLVFRNASNRTRYFFFLSNFPFLLKNLCLCCYLQAFSSCSEQGLLFIAVPGLFAEHGL